MRKLYLALLTGLLTMSAVLVGGGPASAADGAHASATLTCTVSSPNDRGSGNYTFKYVIHWTSRGHQIRIDDVKVTDAAGGHYMRYVRAEVWGGSGGDKIGRVVFDRNGEAYGWQQTLHPRLKLTKGVFVQATSGQPLRVSTSFVGFTDAKGVTPECHPQAAASFWT
jgi:hypothetical protein